ncbi:MAG: hypothetical protein WC578_07035 [Candidatus Omnitrophota bacterium]
MFKKIADKLKVKVNYMEGYCGQEDRQGSINKRYGKGTTKGQFIREKISVILTTLRDVSIKLEEKTFVILIDGTGRIDYNSVVTVLKSLISGEELVLSCRLGKLAVSKKRETVELFENFLVSEKYRVYLPDAQCGCWGFRLTAKDRLPFDSEKYSIEIELLINALKNNINVCFAPVKTIPDTRTSSFKAKDNFDKLKFIAKSLQFDRFDLEAKYLKFIKEKRKKLPASYAALFKKIKREYKNRLRCRNKCGIKCLSQVTKIR